jgi:polyhydroxyalkanoate synthesis repressor PhaR
MLQRKIGLTLLRQMRQVHSAREFFASRLRGKDVDTVAEDTKDSKPDPKPDVVIKKYANRRLYNTATSAYVTLDDLAGMVKSGTNFVVYDAKSGDDITRSVLTQIIFEEESKGENLLPINFLRQLIGLYGHNMQTFVPSYLEFSLDALVREQEKLSRQLVESFGASPFRGLDEQARHNVALFQQAMKMFNPFAVLEADREKSPEPRKAEPESPPPSEPASSDLETLRKQVAAVQRQLEQLSKKTKK